MTEQIVAAAPIPGTPTPPPVAAITPGADAPIATPAEAVAKLDSLKADPVWRDAWLNGDPVRAAQYRDLNELATRQLASNETEAALAGRLEPGFQPAGRLENLAMVDLLRNLEIRDEVIRQTLNGQEVTQEEFNLAKRWKADHMGDKEWSAKYLAGDALAKREKMLCDIILSSPIKEKAA
jgi:hypothetical protein